MSAFFIAEHDVYATFTCTAILHESLITLSSSSGLESELLGNSQRPEQLQTLLDLSDEEPGTYSA